MHMLCVHVCVTQEGESIVLGIACVCMVACVFEEFVCVLGGGAFIFGAYQLRY